jgi:hypothetical protein
MKKAQLYTAALIALGIVSQAGAVNTLYISGSSAFRGLVFNALNAVNPTTPAGGAFFDAGPSYQAERFGTSASGATYMVFLGNVGGTPTYVDCIWTGSDAGLSSVSNIHVANGALPLFGSPATFLKADSSVAAGFSAASPAAGELQAASQQSDIAFVDTSTASALAQLQSYAYTTFPQNTPAAIGVVTFTWYKNFNSTSAASAAKTAWSDLSNISTFQAQVLLAGGSVPADFLTGQAADNPINVYLVGRNLGSGTRANVLNDTTYGVNVAVNQFSIGGGLNFNPDGSPVAPNGTVTPLTSCGNNGYESGLNESLAMVAPGSTAASDPFNPGHGWFAVAYSGVADASGNGNTTAQWLTENGVLESNASVESGEYSYWGYENLYGRSDIGTFELADANLLYNEVITQIAVSGFGVAPAGHDRAIGLTQMNATKATDFSFPTHN